MKKLSFLLISLCLVLFGCPHNADISDGEKTVQEKQYNTISALAYIGGSVVYNPSNPSSAQLYNGANIAVHLGKVIPNTVPAQTYRYTPQNTSMQWTEKQEQIVSVTVDEKSNEYGYLKIQSVSPQAIVFDYHRFISDDRKEVKSYNLQKNETLDLNKDDRPDLRYTPLLPIREGFEGAMCLEFISQQKAGYTTMYATITDEQLSRNVRAFSDYETSTFYGVNSNGSFIYITGENEEISSSRAAFDYSKTVGISHGDYIIDSSVGEIFAVVGNIEGNNTSGSNFNLKGSNDYNLGENKFELETFFTYLYQKNQFADEENGPQALLRSLPKTLLVTENFDLDNCTADEAIDELVKILASTVVIEEIVTAHGGELTDADYDTLEVVLLEYIKALFSEDIYNEIIAQKDNPEEMEKLINENLSKIQLDIEAYKNASLDLIIMNRLCIEQYYPQSPRAIVAVPEVSSVYPLMSLNIAEVPTELNEVAHIPFSKVNSSRGIIDYDELEDDYKDFLKKKNQIDTEFDKFYSFSLSSIKISGLKGDGSQNKSTDKTNTNTDPQKGGSKDENKDTEIDPETCHFDIKLGVTGSFHTRWGHLDSGLASALYISVDANLKDLNIKKNLLSKTLTDKTKTSMIGPVPITFGFTAEIGLDLEGEIQTPVNFAVEFTGMYGAGMDCAVDYGLRKSWNPFSFYLEPKFDGYLIQHSAGYTGFVTKTTSLGNSVGGRIVLKPYLELAPSVALGPQYAYAGIALPLQVYQKTGFGIYPDNNTDSDETWIQKDRVFGNHYVWGKLAIGTSINVKPIIGVRIPFTNKKIETKWEPQTLFNAEVYVLDDGTFKATTGGFFVDKINGK